MKQGGKYQPLFDYLRRSRRSEVILSFGEIEALLGSPLPDSARTTRGWWSNRGKGALQAAAWMEAGYHAAELDIDRGSVVFRKPIRKYKVQRAGNTVLWDGELVRALRRHMGLTQTRLAVELGVRQQTISEWESGVYAPSRAMGKYLTLVAERAGFGY